MTVNVTDLDEVAPLITGEEHATAAHSFTADETVTWSIEGGSDQDKFTIDETTGALSFVNAPVYETPTDSDTNNTYTVI